MTTLYLQKEYLIAESACENLKYYKLYPKGSGEPKPLVFNENGALIYANCALLAPSPWHGQETPNFNSVPDIVLRHQMLCKIPPSGQHAMYYLGTEPFAIYDASANAITNAIDTHLSHCGNRLLLDGTLCIRAQSKQRYEVWYLLKDGNLQRKVIGKWVFTNYTWRFSLYIYKDRCTIVPMDSVSEDIATYSGIESVRCRDIMDNIVEVSPSDWIIKYYEDLIPFALTIGGEVIEFPGGRDSIGCYEIMQKNGTVRKRHGH